MGFVDLHSHVLAGIDDGAPDLTTSLAMLEALAGLGFTEVCATPHQKVGQYLPSADQIRQAFADVGAARRPSMPALHLAAENMWDDVFFERSHRDAVPSYDGGPAFLFELRPPQLPVGIFDHLFRLRTAGKVPVLAHPERYEPLWGDDALAERLADSCAFVVDLPAIAGYHGKRESKMARHLLERGLVRAAATDCHTPGDVKQAAEGLAWIEKKLGARAVARLCETNPRAILGGHLPD
ncbi:MAG TPA: CpsB/CapC family capsule biosynthesis tyrosine phosphatase [Kofleriaceae bacterium]|jgi:protein-tyrosine phosphatase|nr:CpsB/CapC family capsule biosynthesis tyrosine phosphatase [Kofleriaceae bacterium]